MTRVGVEVPEPRLLRRGPRRKALRDLARGARLPLRAGSRASAASPETRSSAAPVFGAAGRWPRSRRTGALAPRSPPAATRRRAGGRRQAAAGNGPGQASRARPIAGSSSDLRHQPAGENRLLFVTEQPGRVTVRKRQAIRAVPRPQGRGQLDQVEQGMFSIAFPPITRRAGASTSPTRSRTTASRSTSTSARPTPRCSPTPARAARSSTPNTARAGATSTTAASSSSAPTATSGSASARAGR